MTPCSGSAKLYGSHPLIGIFDEHTRLLPHGVSAVEFFISFGIYLVKLGCAIRTNREKYPKDEQISIQRLYKTTYWITYSQGAILLSIIIYHS